MTAIFLAAASCWLIAGLACGLTWFDRDLRRIGRDQ